jgi:two-component system CheB/CheR fusion protein
MARSQKKEEAEDLQPADELEPELTVLKPGIDPNEIDASPAPQLDPTLFPLVGIGASAGGLEALEEFFSSMPQDSGAAFVVIMHLSPTRDSLLVDLLQKFTKMTVVQIENAMPLLPNRVHVIPPNREVRLLNGVLQLMEPLPKVRFPLVIDIFFRNLAVDRRRNAVCVILSGSGSDGSLGLRDVKENGGLVIVQDPTTAIHTGMPRSAIETGLAD